MRDPYPYPNPTLGLQVRDRVTLSECVYSLITKVIQLEEERLRPKPAPEPAPAKVEDFPIARPVPEEPAASSAASAAPDAGKIPTATAELKHAPKPQRREKGELKVQLAIARRNIG